MLNWIAICALVVWLCYVEYRLHNRTRDHYRLRKNLERLEKRVLYLSRELERLKTDDSLELRKEAEKQDQLFTLGIGNILSYSGQQKERSNG